LRPNARRRPGEGAPSEGHLLTDNRLDPTVPVALEVARATVDLYHREVLAERIAWLHALVTGNGPWHRIIAETERIVTEVREAGHVVDGIERPAMTATTRESVRASLAERASRSSLVGRFVAHREGQAA
jgi:adenosylmethionine-8-amino-7-oxononanoate aminotransferase